MLPGCTFDIGEEARPLEVGTELNTLAADVDYVLDSLMSLFK